jgi:hypothetical protein
MGCRHWYLLIFFSAPLSHIHSYTPPPPPASHRVYWLFWALFSPTMILYIIPHCKQDRIYVFPDMKLCGLVPDFHINRSLIHECRIWERGRAVSFLGIFANFRYSAINFQFYLKTILAKSLTQNLSITLQKIYVQYERKRFQNAGNSNLGNIFVFVHVYSTTG